MSNAHQSPPTATSAIPSPDEGARALHRGLGVGSIVFMVVAAAAPLGVIAASVPIIISVSGSTAVPLYFLVATVVLTLFAVGFTSMSKYVPNAGAFYSYIQAGLGRPLGTGSAALALSSYGVLVIGVNAYLGVATSNVLTRYLHVSVPWWLCSVIALAIVGFLGYRDIELSSKVLGVLLVAETLVVIVLDVAIVVGGGASGLSIEPLSSSAFTTGAPSLGLMFAFLSFIGFEATAVFRNEAKDPDRTVPRATYIAVVSIGLFYAVSSWAVIEGIGVGNAVEAATSDPENFVLNLATTFISPILTDVMQVLLMTSLFACVLSFHNVITRYQLTLAGKGLLPKPLAEVSQKHLAPSKSSLVASVITLSAMVVVSVVGLDPVTQIYTWLTGAATLGLIALMVLTSLAVIVFFHRNAHGRSVWHSTIAPAISFVGLSIVLVLVVSNFSLLVGDTLTAIVVGGLIVGTFVAGLVGAKVLKHTRPDRYAALSSDD